MKKSIRSIFVSFALIGAYLLSACGGVLPQSTPSNVAQKVDASEIVFTGIVEQINGDQWVVSGQAFTVDKAAVMDSGIAVGDLVKVEGTVSADGNVVALTIESSTASSDNTNDGNSNDAISNVNDNSNDDNSNTGNTNGTDDNSNSAGGNATEIIGLVEAITTDSITIGGITYPLTGSTEFKDVIVVGDQVKIHVIVNADGTFTIREIERSDGVSGNDNSNDSNSNDDDGNDDNSNGDDDNENDDKGDDDNGNGGDDGGNGNDD